MVWGLCFRPAPPNEGWGEHCAGSQEACVLALVLDWWLWVTEAVCTSSAYFPV